MTRAKQMPNLPVKLNLGSRIGSGRTPSVSRLCSVLIRDVIVTSDRYSLDLFSEKGYLTGHHENLRSARPRA